MGLESVSAYEDVIGDLQAKVYYNIVWHDICMALYKV